MSYTASLYQAISEVPSHEWDSLCADPVDPFMDRRLLAAVEQSMSADGKFFYVLMRDADGRPMAAAALCVFRVDGAVLAGPTLKRWAEAIRRWWPGYARLKVLFCGLPVSAGQKHLRLHPEADAALAIAALDDTMRRLARQERVWFIVAKEFERSDLAQLESLKQHGYVLADSLPMNHFAPRFSSLDEYCRALRSHYRYKIKKSLRKFDAAGLQLETLVDPQGILTLYTDDLHQLYNAVVDRAESKLEILPAEFFRQLARQLPGEVSLSVIRQNERIVAFGWGLTRGGAYRSLFIGVDYSLNAETDLYFNTMLRGIDVALQKGATDIFVGQAADDFKARIGCVQQPRFLYLKSPNRLLQAIFRRIARFVFPKPTPPQQHDLFKPEAIADAEVAANA
ncbi:MAG TPA: GNAT family N-acetyltransferase [Pirellulales bacterium]|jgi:predicted N-acyltransferase|nr:GNAT family N-acetyltransferase [Pirellulales bacterium]